MSYFFRQFIYSEKIFLRPKEGAFALFYDETISRPTFRTGLSIPTSVHNTKPFVPRLTRSHPICIPSLNEPQRNSNFKQKFPWRRQRLLPSVLVSLTLLSAGFLVSSPQHPQRRGFYSRVHAYGPASLPTPSVARTLLVILQFRFYMARKKGRGYRDLGDEISRQIRFKT